ncbi:MAG TPA: xylulokinase [Anaerolineae bacterium]|nr:xylulokinase [Anaerolineae bacterium]
MTELLLGIDIGTGSCKCCLVSADGEVVGRATQEYRPHLPKPGWVEQPPEEWYRAVVSCLRQMEERDGLRPDQVGAVGVTGQMRGPTFLDAKGSPVRASILWNDQRCEREVAEIKGCYAEPLRRITHNPLNAMCTLPKLLWVKRHEPELWEKTATVLYPKDYVNWRLTGQRGTDLSDASGSSFYDLERQTWSDEILGDWDLAPEKLPAIRASTTVAGAVSRRAQQEMGLREGVPVAAGGSDATVELLAIGVKSEQQCKIRLGTSGALSTVVDRLAGRGEAGYYVWSYLQADRWMIDLNTRTCADATVWLREVFYQDARSSGAAYEAIGQEAGRVAAGAEGLLFHPYLLGEDAPYWQPHLRGSFFGLTRAHGRAHLARAVLEGTGFALRDARSALGELAAGFREYRFVGGGTRNATWLSIVADILGVDGKVATQVDASVGAAMVAGVAAGVFADLGQAAARCSRVEGAVQHNPENHKAYSLLFERYVTVKKVLDAAYDGGDHDEP